MNFVDSSFVRLADPASRAGLFDSDALEQLVRAMYDADALAVEGPFQPIFDDFRLGLPGQAPGSVEGVINPVGGAVRTEIQLRVIGLGAEDARVDAFWRGTIVARAADLGSTVSEVRVAWPDTTGLDAEIVADLGALPPDPTALESERRHRFLERVRTVVGNPVALTDSAVDDWLATVGATSVGELIDSRSGRTAGTVSVTFAPDGLTATTPMSLPITALLLVRDADFSVAELVAESNTVRQRVGALGIEPPADAKLPRRVPVLIVWVVPQAVFDDPDWPGGNGGTSAEQRAARRAAAGSWLAREGIGLVTPPPPP